mmetsp:Transcript_10691/g.7984  ORF Transcript_10691/g.7984 Transcript_10691/m.7984 type:complete len:82 (-) Transcript_10691:205-450(-)
MLKCADFQNKIFFELFANIFLVLSLLHLILVVLFHVHQPILISLEESSEVFDDHLMSGKIYFLDFKFIFSLFKFFITPAQV